MVGGYSTEQQLFTTQNMITSFNKHRLRHVTVQEPPPAFPVGRELLPAVGGHVNITMATLQVWFQADIVCSGYPLSYTLTLAPPLRMYPLLPRPLLLLNVKYIQPSGLKWRGSLKTVYIMWSLL